MRFPNRRQRRFKAGPAALLEVRWRTILGVLLAPEKHAKTGGSRRPSGGSDIVSAELRHEHFRSVVYAGSGPAANS